MAANAAMSSSESQGKRQEGFNYQLIAKPAYLMDFILVRSAYYSRLFTPTEKEY